EAETEPEAATGAEAAGTEDERETAATDDSADTSAAQGTAEPASDTADAAATVSDDETAPAADTASTDGGAGDGANEADGALTAPKDVMDREELVSALTSAAPVAADRCELILNSIMAQGAVTFATAKSDLEPESFPTLTRLAFVTQKCPETRIAIGGHTDSRGSERSNQALSERRAQAIVTFLVDSGVTQDRLTAEGYGETRPIASNDTSAGRARNRRIEFNVR
ncbi:MAG: OmpA family protein, partial [Pseudomonadota bacterium]